MGEESGRLMQRVMCEVELIEDGEEECSRREIRLLLL